MVPKWPPYNFVFFTAKTTFDSFRRGSSTRLEVVFSRSSIINVVKFLDFPVDPADVLALDGRALEGGVVLRAAVRAVLQGRPARARAAPGRAGHSFAREHGPQARGQAPDSRFPADVAVGFSLSLGRNFRGEEGAGDSFCGSTARKPAGTPYSDTSA